MNAIAGKVQETKSKTMGNTTSQKKCSSKSTFQLAGHRPQKAITQRKLQEIATDSPQAKQLRAFQEMADNSPQVKQLRAYQAMADNYIAQKSQQNGNIKEPADANTGQSVARPMQWKSRHAYAPAPVLQRKLVVHDYIYIQPPKSAPTLIAEASIRNHVPESRIENTLNRWLNKKRQYHFPSWSYALDEVAKGINKSQGKEKITKEYEEEKEAQKKKQDKETQEAERKLKELERETTKYNEAKKGIDLVRELRKFAHKKGPTVTSAVVDPTTYEIKGQGAKGDLDGKLRYNAKDEIEPRNTSDGPLTALATHLKPTERGTEEWNPWHCAEPAAMHNAIVNGTNPSAPTLVAIDFDGYSRKLPCGHCERWTNSLPKLDILESTKF